MTVCSARFLKQRLKDSEQDARMDCVRHESHVGRHRNADGTLFWSRGLEVDVAAILDAPGPFLIPDLRGWRFEVSHSPECVRDPSVPEGWCTGGWGGCSLRLVPATP